MPANTAVYIEQFRDLVEFNTLKPDNLLKLVNNKYSIAFFKGLGQQELLNTMESTGITNTDSVNNLQVFLFIFVVILIVLLAPIPFLVFNPIRPLVERKVKENIKKTFYNGIITTQTFSYLKASITFGVAFKMIDWIAETPANKVKQIMPIVVLVIFPFICFIVLYTYKRYLHNSIIKDRISSMF